MLLVPAAAQLLQAVVPVAAGVRIRREPARVHPERGARGPGLEGGDPGGDPVQQLAVVRDEQHRLRRGDELVLEPALGGDVEVVVRLVEDEDVLGAAEERLEDQALLLAAGQRGDLAPLRLLEGDAEGGDGAGVPQGLVLVAARVAPVDKGLGVGQLTASLSCSIISSSVPSTSAAALRTLVGATVSSRSRTVESSRS